MAGSKSMRLLNYLFVYAASIEPDRHPDGSLLEITHKHADATQLNQHASGPFCMFDVSHLLPSTSGVFVVTVDDAPKHVGMTVNLARRWGHSQYGNITCRNCHADGQTTHCRVNNYILRAARKGRRVHLWIRETLDRQRIKKELLQELHFPWNG